MSHDRASGTTGAGFGETGPDEIASIALIYMGTPMRRFEP